MKDNWFQWSDYFVDFREIFSSGTAAGPWETVSKIQGILEQKLLTISGDYHIHGAIAIHKTANIEEHAVLKGPLIIGKNCFIASHCYLRGGVFLGDGVRLGPGCEVKSSYILSESALAHFNFAGDSIIGSQVNMEAGAVIANCFNERSSKEVEVIVGGTRIKTGLNKFGALIGDQSKIGANAVLSPGTVLPKESVVGRLQLIEQFKLE